MLGRKRRNILQGEVEALKQRSTEMEPYLGLAKEIKDEVARLALKGYEVSYTELFDSFQARERQRTIQQSFEKLEPADKWMVLSALFEDHELKAALEVHYARLRDRLSPVIENYSFIKEIRDKKRIDVANVPTGQPLKLGLYLPADVGSALPMGQASQACARELTLLAVEAGHFQVLKDEYNPKKGYFVRAEYDRTVWAESEQLPQNSIIELGTQVHRGVAVSFEPYLYPGGRVDVMKDNQPSEGRLHLGYATISDYDLLVSSDR